MKPEQDAFGQFLLANLNNNTSDEIIERDDNFISVMRPDLYFSEYKDWSPHVKSGLELAKGRILDIGLGAGRHALYLQEQGFEVVGIDNSPLAVQVAKARGVNDSRVMSITNIDDSLGQFDTIIMLGNNWGLLGGYLQGQSILKRLYEITSDDAKIIAETTNPYTTEDPLHLQYHELNRQKGRMSGQIRFRVRYRQYCGDWMDYLLASIAEVKLLIDGTGWNLVQTFGDIDGQYTLILEK
jgi:SAM-dependent methyltransferase